MRLLLLICLSAAFLIISCKFSSHNIPQINIVNKKVEVKKEFPLTGIWANFSKGSVDFFEIMDSLDIQHYMLLDYNLELERNYDDRYSFYKSKGYISYIGYDSILHTIQSVKIKEPEGWFFFNKRGDTLILTAEIGEFRKYVKIYTEEEKAFRYYYSNDIKGIVQGVSRDSSGLLFITKRVLKNPMKDKTEKFENYMFEYDFSYLEKTFENYKTLNDLASSGDSIIKPAFSDTLLLYKSNTKEYIKIAFKKK